MITVDRAIHSDYKTRNQLELLQSRPTQSSSVWGFTMWYFMDELWYSLAGISPKIFEQAYKGDGGGCY